MAISQALCSSFKYELFLATHDFDTDTFKIALYSSAATLDATTTVYTAANETTGTGYAAGGEVLTGVAVSLTGTTAFVDFADATWAGAVFTARGALIYNASKANKAVAVLDFGADKTSAGAAFIVQMPVNEVGTALVRIA